MLDKIYEIYLGNYHYETAIDKKGLTVLLYGAERDAEFYKKRGIDVSVTVKEIPISSEEIAQMQVAKYRAAEKRWEEEDRLKIVENTR